jgi:hypothetical protein
LRFDFNDLQGSVLGGGYQLDIISGPGAAALDALDVNAVGITFYGEVSAASFTGFRPDETQHFSPEVGMLVRWFLVSIHIYTDNSYNLRIFESGQPLF